MQDKMKEANLPEPLFVNEREDFVVTFYNGEYPELYPEVLKKDKKTQDKKTQDKKNQDKKTQDKRIVVLNEILQICQKEPQSIKQIMERLDYKSSKTFKKYYIKPLLEEGKLKMTLPEKPTSKNQKYITVD